MKKEIKVSIIVPIYNVEKFLDQCISSILNQTYKNLEVILVNDGSEDNSSNIMEKYLKEDNRIKIITKKNGGLSSTRNVGIDVSTGDYIMHVDGDDFINKDTIENMVTEIINSKENIDVVVGDLELFYGNNKKKVWKDSLMEENKIYSGKDYLEKYFFLGKACYSSCNKLWKRELYIKNNIYHPTEISLGEDSNTVARLMINAEKIIKLNSSVYNYRINLNGMMKSKGKKLLDYKKSIEILEKYFYEKNILDFFDKYKTSHTFFSFYENIILVSYKEIRNDYKNNNDYLVTKKLFEQDIENIIKDKNILENVTLKQKIILKIYDLNFELAENLIFLYRTIKRKFIGER